MNFKRLFDSSSWRVLSIFLLAVHVTLFNTSPASAASKSGDASSSASAPLVYVQLRSTKLRTEPAMWATSAGEVKYGDALSVEQPANNGWTKVKSPKGIRGYIHGSAIAKKPVVLSMHGDVSKKYAEPSEVVLAGKGFSHEVEKEYSRTTGVDFRAVDQVEKVKVGPDEAMQFARAGKLQTKKK